jgi:hypothetical protein
MYCIGCGEPLRATTGRCPSCRTAVVGAQFGEKVAVEYGTRIVVPPVCCCCLAPRDDERREEIASVSFFTLEKRYTKIPIPWCATCRKRRGAFGWVTTATVALFGIPLYFLLPASWGMGAALAALVGGILGAVLSTPLVRRVFPTVELPGHVPECDAVGGGASSSHATLDFRNRAFARIWQELNSGVASQAPALRWAEVKPRPGEKPVPRAPQAHSTIETRARVRDQLQAGKSGPLSRMGLGTRPVGPDAAAEVWAADRSDPGGRLRATDRTGKSEGPSPDLESRRQPRWTSFLGAIFLIPSAADGPIRLLPATRTNYAALPGSGATSHENFRRMVRYLKAKNPAVTVEPASAPYLEEGKGFPPALSTTEAVVEYESQFGALRAGT